MERADESSGFCDPILTSTVNRFLRPARDGGLGIPRSTSPTRICGRLAWYMEDEV